MVRLGGALREHADGRERLELDVPEPVTAGAVLDGLAASHPAVARRVRDETGVVRRHVNVFVGSDNIRDVDGAGTPVPPAAEVSVLPAVSGG